MGDENEASENSSQNPQNSNYDSRDPETSNYDTHRGLTSNVRDTEYTNTQNNQDVSEEEDSNSRSSNSSEYVVTFCIND